MVRSHQVRYGAECLVSSPSLSRLLCWTTECASSAHLYAGGADVLAHVAAIFFERSAEVEVQTRAARRFVVVNDNEIRAAGAGLTAHAALPDDDRRGWFLRPSSLG